jgi:hypothetical protein
VFSLATGGIDLTGADYYGAGTYPADFLIEASDGSAVANLLTVTPPGGYSAIGFELGSFNGGPFVATLSDGASFTIDPQPYDDLSFYGFTSASPITSLTLSIPAGDTFVIDQAVLADTPEPAPGPLVAATLAFAALFGRRRLLRSL